MKKPTIIEIEEQIIAMVEEDELTVIKSSPSGYLAVLFMGLVIFIGAIACLIIFREPYCLILIFGYLLIAAIVFIRKRIIFNFRNESIQTEYILGKYTLLREKLYLYQGKSFYMVNHVETDQGLVIKYWYELHVEQKKLITLLDSKGAKRMMKGLETHFIVQTRISSKEILFKRD